MVQQMELLMVVKMVPQTVGKRVQPTVMMAQLMVDWMGRWWVDLTVRLTDDQKVVQKVDLLVLRTVLTVLHSADLMAHRKDQQTVNAKADQMVDWMGRWWVDLTVRLMVDQKVVQKVDQLVLLTGWMGLQLVALMAHRKDQQTVLLLVAQMVAQMVLHLAAQRAHWKVPQTALQLAAQMAAQMALQLAAQTAGQMVGLTVPQLVSLMAH